MVSKRRLLLSVVFAFSGFAFMACDDGVSSESKTCTPACAQNQVCEDGTCKDVEQGTQCTAGEAAVCAGTEQVKECVDGSYKYVDCTDGKVCKNGACVGCTNGDKKCATDTSFQLCTDEVWGAAQNCGTGETCSGAGVCEKEVVKICTENEKRCGAVANAFEVCTNNAWVSTVCENSDFVCKDGNCVDPNICTPACTGSSVCVNGSCQTVIADTQIGKPCTCSGTECIKSLDLDTLEALAELKKSIPLLSGLKLGVVTFPDFFSKSIKGCEALTATEGTTVGCLRDDSVKFSKEFTDAMTLVKALMPDLAFDLPSEINLYAKNGYCFLGALALDAVEPEGTGMDKILASLIKELGVQLNTGDYTIVNTCPEGSELVKHVLEQEAQAGSTPKLDIGVAVCLKACRTDSDCRATEDYKCLDVPSGDGVLKKVCLDPKNIESVGALIPQK